MLFSRRETRTKWCQESGEEEATDIHIPHITFACLRKLTIEGEAPWIRQFLSCFKFPRLEIAVITEYILKDHSDFFKQYKFYNSLLLSDPLVLIRKFESEAGIIQFCVRSRHWGVWKDHNFDSLLSYRCWWDLSNSLWEERVAPCTKVPASNSWFLNSG